MERLSFSTRSRVLSFSATSVLALAAFTSWMPLAMAQEASDPPSRTTLLERDEGLNREIVITGSRIARSGFEASTPVTVLNSEDIAKLGIVNTSDVVGQLPQNSQFTSPTNVGAGNFNIGASLANLRGLNPFFGTRTLTLVDTRRWVPTTDGGAVDLNVIPSQLIARVETVTGGASAAYGSDAVAGVVNIILDTRLQGFKGQVDYGVTTRGDGGEAHMSAAYGTGFAGGSGRLIIGGEYSRSDAINGCGLERSWCASGPNSGYGLFTNPNFATDDLPNYILGPNARAYSSVTGVFPPGLFPSPFPSNLQFNADGTALVPYEPGSYAAAIGFAPMQGGANSTQDAYRDNALRPQIKRYSLFGHAEYDVTSALQAYIEGSYYKNIAVNIQAQEGASVFTSKIFDDNAFLPAGAAATLGLPAYFPGVTAPPYPPGTPGFMTFGNFSSNGVFLPQRENHTATENYRGSIGVKGALSETWRFDAYYTYGRTDTHVTVANSLNNVLFGFALDAVDQGAATTGVPNGNVVCRATLPGAGFNPRATGCAPLNLFGLNDANGYDNSAGVAYAYRTLIQDVRYQQHVAAATIRGDLFQGWGAGPIGIAAGGEYRHESIRTTHDIAEQQYPDGSGSYYYDFGRPYGEEYAGKMDILEAFAEVSVPVLKDIPFFKILLLNGAVRETRNKTTGGVTSGLDPAKHSNTVDFLTWKLNGVWDVNDWVRFRATRSHDVRAPSFFELYGQSINNGGFFGAVENPVLGGAPFNSDSALVRLGGSDANLGPEKADTVTAGVVLTGNGALSGFRVSIDWYQVKLDGPISTLGTQNIVNACYNQGTFCQYIAGTGQVNGTGPDGVGTGFGDITDVFNLDLNLGTYVARGLDMEADYRLRLGEDSSVNFRVIASYLYDLIIDPGTGALVRNYAGISGPTAAFGYFNTSPKWQGNAFVNYSTGGFSGTVQAKYVGPGKFALLAADGNPYIAPGDPGYSDDLPNSINTNHVASAVYFNLSLSQRVSIGGSKDRSFELFGLINNIFDKKPPIAPGGNGFPTNPVFFDTIGASVRVGARIRY